MAKMTDARRTDRLYTRSMLIRDRRANGAWLPIVRYLARRGYPSATTDLADWTDEDGQRAAARLHRRVFRRNDRRAADNIAMARFNRNVRAGYRRWLSHAAAGDPDARVHHRAFETRLPHADARRIGRLRPCRRSERA